VTLGRVDGVWHSYSVLLVALVHEFAWPRVLLRPVTEPLLVARATLLRSPQGLKVLREFMWE